MSLTIVFDNFMKRLTNEGTKITHLLQKLDTKLNIIGKRTSNIERDVSSLQGGMSNLQIDMKDVMTTKKAYPPLGERVKSTNENLPHDLEYSPPHDLEYSPPHDLEYSPLRRRLLDLPTR